MESGYETNSEIVFYPRDKKFTASAPEGLEPASWESKHAVVGISLFNSQVVGGGINEHGLAAANLNLLSSKYQNVTELDNGNIIGSLDVIKYFLTQFKDVEEVKMGLEQVKVSQVMYDIDGIKYEIKLHFTFHDPTGASIVVEYVDRELKVYDNELGVMTNQPTFDWHLINLRNYINLKPKDAPPVEVGNIKLVQTGVGSGMVGLPGDVTPPSRFVRTVAFTQNTPPLKTHDEGLNMAMQISNAMSFPKGIALSETAGIKTLGNTQWVMIADLKTRHMYFRHYDYIDWLFVDLKKIDPNSKESKRFPMRAGPTFEEISGKMVK
jgi:choloylglycine hydrolase